MGTTTTFEAVSTSISNIFKKRKYVTFTRDEILNIGKYASTIENFRPARKYSVGERTVRLHRKKYEHGLTSSTKVKCGRTLLLGSDIDEKVMKYQHVIRKKGGVVNKAVTIAIAQALITKSEDKNLKMLDLEKTSWTKSLFYLMRFVKRSATTCKPAIPDGVKKEAGLLYHHQIITFVEEHDKPSSLVMNFDQTPLKYAPVSSQTLAKRGSKHVSISNATHCKSLTATLGISLDNKFLPFQLIYGGKTQQSLPKVNFPKEFSLRINESISATHKRV